MKSEYEHMSEKEIRAQIKFLEDILATDQGTPSQGNRLYDLRVALRVIVEAKRNIPARLTQLIH